MPDHALPTSPLHALCVYAEPLVVGRRVVVFGDAETRLGERFLELGARVVHVYDPRAGASSPAQSSALPRGLSVQPLPAGDFDVRDGAFDVAVVPDIGDIAAPAALLGRMRRLLAPGGAALVRGEAGRGGGSKEGARARSQPPSLDYYELYDLVAMQFAHVRMVGEVAWNGVALAELGQDADDPEVTVDTQLVREPFAPDAFVALGSQEDVRLAPYSLVQLPEPADSASQARLDRDDEALRSEGSARADLAAAQLRASLLEAQVDELRARRNEQGASHADAVGTLEAELKNRLLELREAETVAEAEQARALSFAAELRKRDEEVARLGDYAALASREVEEERSLRLRAEVERVASLQALEAALEAAARNDRVRDVALSRLPVLEASVLDLDARATDLGRRLVASEDARAVAEGALRIALAELEVARTAAVLATAERAAERDLGREGSGEVPARISELEAVVAALDLELAATSDGHATELNALETALRGRATVVQSLEEEIGRRDRIVHDLVEALAEAAHGASEASSGSFVAAESGAPGFSLEAESELRDARARAERARAENADLRLKLDAAALEIARREGDSATSAWRIQELEQAVLRLEDEQTELTMTIPPPAFVQSERDASHPDRITQRLAAAEEELDVLRQALAQEHAARARAEAAMAAAPGDGAGAPSPGS